MKVKTIDGVKSGFKHTAPDIHMRILQRMGASSRRGRGRKRPNGLFMGRQILTRTCTKAFVSEKR
jgi:hypothetical protein